mgnify:CR=1 FL=1
MSIGIGAYANTCHCKIVILLVYEYGGYNLNEEKYRNKSHVCDGFITIQRNCFLEPEIHEKLKKDAERQEEAHH